MHGIHMLLYYDTRGRIANLQAKVMAIRDYVGSAATFMQCGLGRPYMCLRCTPPKW